MSIDRGMAKEDVVHIYNGILLSHKKNKIMPFAATWMDLETVIMSEVGQTEKDEYHYDITYMWNLKKCYKRTCLQSRNRVTVVENNALVTRGEGGGRINWEIGIDIYTLLYIKYISNKDLLYSTGNSTRYSVMTYMGKESKKD